MALNKYNQVILNFNANTEYSLDNGATWVALNANTQKTVTDAEMLNQYNGRVKVRSVNNVTTISKVSMKFSANSYRAFHVRNGGTLTTLNTSLQDCTIDHVKFEGMTALLTMEDTFRSTNILVLYDISLPVCTSTNVIAPFANIDYFGSMNAPLSIKFASSFVNMTARHIGSIALNRSANVNIHNLMEGLKCGSYPNLSIGGIGDGFENYSSDGAGRRSTVVYGLYTKFNVNVYTNATARRMFDRQHIKFCGFDMKYVGIGAKSGLASSFTAGDMYGNDDVNLFSKLSLDASSSDNALPTAFTVNAVGWDSQLVSDLRVSSTVVDRTFDWLPIGRQLSSKTRQSSVPLSKASYYSNNLFSGWVDSNGDVYEGARIGGLEHVNTYSVVKTLASDKVWFGQNGTYAVQTGADVKVYDNSDVLLSTIVGITATHIDISTDGTSMTVTQAGSFVSTGTDITTVFTVHNTTSGVVTATHTLIAPDKVILGTHSPYSTSKFNIVYNNYVGGVVVATVVDNYTNISLTTQTITYTLPNVMTSVYHSFSDSAEFYAINNINGNIEWLFTS